MGYVNHTKEQEYLRLIQPLVDEELIKRGLLNIVDDEKYYAFGSNKVKEELQKQILKEKYNIDFDGIQDNTIDIFY